MKMRLLSPVPTSAFPLVAVLSSLLLLSSVVVASHGNAEDHDFYSVVTQKADWDECMLEYTPNCPPTITIEQAACEAPLVVNGRVLQAVNGETREDTVVQIQVDYLSEFFGSIDRRTIQKWGAGLENDADGSIFNASGFFTTWITSGFNNTPTDLAPAGFGTTPCGTRSPQSQETLFFFLQGLPENEGKKVEFLDEKGTLNVNFSLSTSILQTGMVEDTADTYELVAAGAFNDDNRLNGNCEVVYCCYNRDCGKCDSILAEVQGEFACKATFAPPGGSPRPASVMMAGLLIILGLLSSM